MGILTVRLSNDLHDAVRKAASTGITPSMNAFAAEAIAEKVGRSQLNRELEDLRKRVKRLEQRK